MITEKNYDSIVIGAGAAGMAAASTICEAGYKVALLDREECMGGILMQCIHNGFGLHHFKEELTGPEYAEQYIRKISSLPVDLYLDSTVVDIGPEPDRIVTAYSSKHGILKLSARSVILAMGCRERNRGNIGIPGSRPSGIFTAGLAQRLLNIDGYIPGEKVVIIGSGDIGMIMARRLSWVGSKVLCVVEILPYPSGLTRNIVQCLQDFGIPLHLSHTVTTIEGKDRVEAVEISPLVNGVPDADRKFRIECDTILLSVGLVPENELSRKAGVVLNPDTGGPVVDHTFQTNCKGIFACGNVLHVHDLVDYVSEESEECGKSVVAFLQELKTGDRIVVPAIASVNCKYVVPNSYMAGEETKFYMRSLVVGETAELLIRQDTEVLFRRKLHHVRPAEMLAVTLTKEESRRIREKIPLEFSLVV